MQDMTDSHSVSGPASLISAAVVDQDAVPDSLSKYGTDQSRNGWNAMVVRGGGLQGLPNDLTSSLLGTLQDTPAKCQVSCSPQRLVRIDQEAGSREASALQCDPIGPGAIFDASSSDIELDLLGLVMSPATVGLPTVRCQLPSGVEVSVRLPSTIVPDFSMALTGATATGSDYSPGSTSLNAAAEILAQLSYPIAEMTLPAIYLKLVDSIEGYDLQATFEGTDWTAPDPAALEAAGVSTMPTQPYDNVFL